MSKTFCILAREIFTPYKRLENGFIVVEDGMIKDVGSRGKFAGTGMEILDFSDCIVAPGLIDIHIHGIAGRNTMDAKTESIREMAKALATHGVTSFSPTLEAAPLDVLKKSLKAIASVRENVIGAKIVGVNLEGPFLSTEKPGAMKIEYIRPPSIEEFDELYDASQRTVKLTTIAPEQPKAIEVIRYISSLGVTVSMGHTNATYEKAIEAIKAGATHVTHLFNAMRVFQHREPGVIGAVLENPDVSIELITDLVHIHPAVIKLIYRVKPIERIVTVTDSVLADVPRGAHRFWEYDVIVRDDVAVLPDGTLFGSVLALDKALHNLVFKVGIPMRDALTTMTIAPARVIKLEKEIGSIEKGKRADLIIMDQKLNILKTFINGKLIYDKKS